MFLARRSQNRYKKNVLGAYNVTLQDQNPYIHCTIIPEQISSFYTTEHHKKIVLVLFNNAFGDTVLGKSDTVFL